MYCQFRLAEAIFNMRQVFELGFFHLECKVFVCDFHHKQAWEHWTDVSSVQHVHKKCLQGPLKFKKYMA